ncbi:MAG: alpha/beta hydrolase-fold protein [Longimicrobiales bacterium]
MIITRTANTEPRFQVRNTGVPFFGRDVEQLEPGEVVLFDDSVMGYPVAALSEIPPGSYYVQAFVNIYTEFRRADGNVLWMHEDQWEGQNWRSSPGNLYSVPRQVQLDASTGYTIRLTADQVIPPIQVPADNQWVQRFKIQSPMLSKFWGRPIYLGATVLLPRDYATSTISYPVLYSQGHFSLANPLRFEVGGDVYNDWVKDDFPRMLVVTFQHPNPYYDDSYAVNSVNVGPYGDAILEELIPEVERRYRIIREPWARLLDGGSTGGWESLALQLFHPDFFGGTWSYCPDPVTFSEYEQINLYEDRNAIYREFEWRREPVPQQRETDGKIRLTWEQRARYERVAATRGRSGEQNDIWSAVYGPIGEDGYFKPVFDNLTGVIDKDVVEYWKRYDLLYYLRDNWAVLGPKVEGKLHIYTGDMDTHALNNAVVLLENWMKTTTNPHYKGFFMYGDRQPHCWRGPGSYTDRIEEMAQYLLRRKPGDTTTPWWKY